MDVEVQPGKVTVNVHSKPSAALTIRFNGREINVSEPGEIQFVEKKEKKRK